MTLTGNSLAARIARRILAIVLISLLLASALLSWFTWREESERIDNLITQVGGSFAIPMAESIWMADPALLRSQLQAITRIDGIARASVETFTGQKMESDSQPDSTSFASRQIELAHEGRSVGKLYLEGDRQALVKAVIDHLRKTMTLFAIILAVGGAALYWLIRREAASPIARITDNITEWTPTGGQAPLVFKYPVSTELDSLLSTLQMMQGILAWHLKQENDLKDELEDRVEQRTIELKASNTALAQRSADLEHALDDLKNAQAQLVHSEKMASIGQLVANIAHEINSPIGAVKASSKNIADAVQLAIQQLPKVFGLLTREELALFGQLVTVSRTVDDPVSTREERAQARATAEELERLGLRDTQRMAAMLVQLGVQQRLDDIEPLLRHPESDFLMHAALTVATILNNTSNINTAVDRVSKIIFTLKSLSRMDGGGRLTSARLQDSLEAALTLYANHIKQGTRLVRNFEDLPPIPCHPEELAQVWINLIHNALQAMNYEGTLTVSLKQQGTSAVVAISDTGSGIPEEIRQRIFEPFFTTRPAGEGSGLGLDIVRKIVDRHRGRIEVTSEVGVGSTFSVFLPLNAESMPAIEAQSAAGRAERLIWDASYTVGVKSLDNQHRSLFILVNQLADCLDMPAAQATGKFVDIVKGLFEYARLHFEDEEAYQKRIGYPQRTSHEREHTQFVAKIGEIEQSIKTGTIDIVATYQFLREWLLAHVLESDMHYRYYAESRKAGSTPPNS